MELRSPVLMRRKAMITDSGGAGRRRGGPGQEFVLECAAAEPITCTIRPDLIKFPAPGLLGGHSGRLGEVFLNGARVERFPPMEFRPRDVLTIRVPGAGGYGDPRQREPERVRADIESGIVSVQAAREIYGVEVMPR
jgi:N-methylhydantoinase B